MFRTSLRAVLGALLLLTTLQPTAFARTLDEILSAGTLTVGINPTLPPLGLFDEANQVDGFDAEVAAKLAEMLGVELEIVQVGSPDRIPFVASGGMADARLTYSTCRTGQTPGLQGTNELHILWCHSRGAFRLV